MTTTLLSVPHSSWPVHHIYPSVISRLMDLSGPHPVFCFMFSFMFPHFYFLIGTILNGPGFNYQVIIFLCPGLLAASGLRQCVIFVHQSLLINTFCLSLVLKGKRNKNSTYRNVNKEKKSVQTFYSYTSMTVQVLFGIEHNLSSSTLHWTAEN